MLSLILTPKQVSLYVYLHLTIAQHVSQAYLPGTGTDHALSRPMVHTRVGCFRGLQAQDGNYSMYLGIPYAQVDPENVFGPAVPYIFEDIFNAFDDSARCPQIEEFNQTITGTLDCLHLNIYVPNTASIYNPLPVMMYTFGGKYQFGFAGRYIYGPRFVVRHDVIFVTFNYRLGPYGFMCLNTEKVPGNEGLKDQILALRWIKNNIRYFGGDDSKITLVGNSAGAVSVDFHQYYLQEKLYHRIILQSGVALFYKTMQNDPDRKAPFKLARQLNYTAKDIQDALSYLSKVDPHDLIAAYRDSGILVGPCVEIKFENTSNYITKHPINVNKVKNVDVIIGFNNDETYAGIITVEDKEFESTDYVSDYMNGIFKFNNESKLSSEIKKIIRQRYFGDDSQNASNRKPTMDLYSDLYCLSPILRTVRKYVESEVKNIYLYMFSYSGERNFAKDKVNLSRTEGGAAHADELGYLFDISYMKDRLREEDILIIDRMTELWTNFVKHGNPTPSPSKLIPLRWPRVTKDRLPYLEIDTELRLGSSPMHERMSFMDLLFKMIGRYQRGIDARSEQAKEIMCLLKDEE